MLLEHISQRTVIFNLRFADDISTAADSSDELQAAALLIIDNVYSASIKFGLRVNCSKTEVQCIGRERLR